MSEAYYKDPTSFSYIERAILIEDVKLPIYNEKKKLKRHFFYNIQRLIDSEFRIFSDSYNESYMNKEYKLAYNELKNIDAQFYIPVLMPKIQESSTDITKTKAAPSKRGFKGQNINAYGYSYSNSVTLTIPKYILIQFLDNKTEIVGEKDPFIPKGTEFLVACVGGIMDVDLMRIIGLFTTKYDRQSFPNLTDDYYGGNPVL